MQKLTTREFRWGKKSVRVGVIWGRPPRCGGSSVFGRMQIKVRVSVRRTIGVECLWKSPRARGLLSDEPRSLAGTEGLGRRGARAVKQFSRCPEKEKQWCSARLPNQVRLTGFLHRKSHQGRQTPGLPEHSQVHPAGHLSAELMCSGPHPSLWVSVPGCSCLLSGTQPCTPVGTGGLYLPRWWFSAWQLMESPGWAGRALINTNAFVSHPKILD